MDNKILPFAILSICCRPRRQCVAKKLKDCQSFEIHKLCDKSLSHTFNFETKALRTESYFA